MGIAIPQRLMYIFIFIQLISVSLVMRSIGIGKENAQLFHL